MFMKFSFFDANKYFKYILFEFDVLISSPVVSLRISKVAKLFSSAVNGRWIAHQNIHKKNEKARDKERSRRIFLSFGVVQFWREQRQWSNQTAVTTVNSFPPPSTLSENIKMSLLHFNQCVLHCTLRNGALCVSLLSRSIADPQGSYKEQASIFTSKQAYTCMAD